jgi:hypothetical protein
MSSPAPNTAPALKDRFAWYDKLLARAVLAGMVLVGAIAIYRGSPWAAAAYLGFGLVGGLLVIYDLLCVYCPYPYQYNDCLFFPAPLLAAVAKRRTGKIPWLRKALLVVIVAALVLVPQYWLWDNPALLAGFWALAAAIAVAFPGYYCRRCRHGQCPLNRAAEAKKGEPSDRDQASEQ